MRLDDIGSQIIAFGVIFLFFVLWVSIESIKEANLKKEKEAHRQRIEEKRLRFIAKLQPIWGEDICRLLAQKKIEIGMTKEMVICAWGRPHKVDSEELTEKFEKIRWVYGKPRINASYVTFKNNLVVSIRKTGDS